MSIILQKGCQGQIVPPDTLLEGPVISYGILRGCSDILRRAYNVGRDFYHVDHGYIQRVDWSTANALSKGYFRVTKNRLSARYDPNPLSPKFADLHNSIQLRPFNHTGSHIVICGMTDAFANNHPYLKLNAKEWLKDIVRELSRYTDRPIVVKEKSEGKLTDVIQNAHCVVTHSSNAGIDSLVHGIPVIAVGECVTNIGLPISDIEGIHLVDWDKVRSNVIATAINNQYSVKELMSFDMWEKLGCNHEVI